MKFEFLKESLLKLSFRAKREIHTRLQTGESANRPPYRCLVPRHDIKGLLPVPSTNRVCRRPFPQQLMVQEFPIGVKRLNQRNFFLSTPALDFFLSRNCIVDVLCTLVID